MKRLLSLLTAGVVACAVFVGSAEAAPGKGKGHRDYRSDGGYFHSRDVTVIREYYRPYYRPLPPGLQKKYARTGYLPPGWAKRVRPVPVYVERQLVPVPYGYHRGLIDGNAVVYNDRGFILDLATLF